MGMMNFYSNILNKKEAEYDNSSNKTNKEVKYPEDKLKDEYIKRIKHMEKLIELPEEFVDKKIKQQQIINSSISEIKDISDDKDTDNLNKLIKKEEKEEDKFNKIEAMKLRLLERKRARDEFSK